LRCPACGSDSFSIQNPQREKDEIRGGALACTGCCASFPIREGILDLLGKPSEALQHEQHAMSAMRYYVSENPQDYITVSKETFQNHAPIFLSLPEGDGSYIFRKGGLQNQAENAVRFYQTVDALRLRGNESVLEIGASFGWAAARFAQKGCSVVAVDVTDYLLCSDLYFKAWGVYFERFWADMNRLPFKDGVFDLVFANSVLHHSMDLRGVFSELLRVLRPGGKMVSLAECSLGLFEKRDNEAMQRAQADGSAEHTFRLGEWKSAAKRAGFRRVTLEFFSVIDSYIDKKKNRGTMGSWKVKLALFVQRHAWLKGIYEGAFFWHRWLFRPGDWKLVCYK